MVRNYSTRSARNQKRYRVAAAEVGFGVGYGVCNEKINKYTHTNDTKSGRPISQQSNKSVCFWFGVTRERNNTRTGLNGLLAFDFRPAVGVDDALELSL